MHNYLRSGLIGAALLVSPLFSQAQEQSGPLPCGTQQAVEQLMRRNPAYARQMQDQVNRIRLAQERQEQRSTQLTPKVIPIVVHIIHDYTGSNISREQVMDAVRMINEDFNYLNADTVNVISPFKNRVANAQIEFRLAKLDPNGNCTDGITRTYSPLTNSADDNVKDLIRWNPDNYLNIWVVRNISFGAGGYAYYPCAGPDIDGIVVRNAQFGSIGTSSPSSLPRSLTHEIGHYLDLPHTWGNSNEPGLPSNCSIDDGITDTPNTVGVSGGGCNTAASSCGNLNNVQNVMDYASCQLMFTHGQKDVMQDALEFASCRTNLWSQTNLVATGANDGYTATACTPVADFVTVRQSVCEGTAVQFTDLSWNAVVDSTWVWNWSFPGATPATSSDKNPQVTYLQPGTYPVTLTVSNAGGTDALTRTDYMVVEAVNTGLSAPLVEGFENPTFPQVTSLPLQSWDIEIGANSAATWEQTSIASASGSNSLRIQHGQIDEGEINSLVSPSIDVSGISPKVLTFKLAYAPADNTWSGNDRLKVYASSDCGQTWTLRYAKSGASLQTAPPVAGQFIPFSPTHWRQETVTLSNTASHLMLKFESTSGLSNTLYIDDINLSSGVVGTEESAGAAGLWVYPNPSEGQAQIRFFVPEGSPVTLQLTDAIGKQVGSTYRSAKAGENEISLNTLAGKLAPGMYFLQLQSAQGSRIQKLIIN